MRQLSMLPQRQAQCILHFLQMPIEDSFPYGVDDAVDKIQKHADPGPPYLETTESEEVHEMKESEIADVKDQSVFQDVSKINNANGLETSGENGANIAIDALRAAFEANGYMAEQGSWKPSHGPGKSSCSLTS